MKEHRNSPLFFSLTWDFLEEYLPKQAGRSPETVESYRDTLTLLRRFLTAEKRISLSKFAFCDCTKDFIFDFRDFLKSNGNKASTINVRLTAIRSYLNYAADKDVTIQSVAIAVSQVPPCKKIQEERKVISEEALAAILSAPPQTKIGLRDRTIMILLYDCAIRLNELLSIRICDIMMEGDFPSILIHGKGSKERRVQISESSVGHLKDYLRVFHGGSSDGAYLFSTTIKGVTDKMSSGNVQRIIAQYAAIARKGHPHVPEKIHPHMFRRTRATYLYQDGIALELISAILGHSSLETTKLYYGKKAIMERKSADSRA
jgi:site-specific recombinase XerD